MYETLMIILFGANEQAWPNTALHAFDMILSSSGPMNNTLQPSLQLGPEQRYRSPRLGARQTTMISRLLLLRWQTCSCMLQQSERLPKNIHCPSLSRPGLSHLLPASRPGAFPVTAFPVRAFPVPAFPVPAFPVPVFPGLSRPGLSRPGLPAFPVPAFPVLAFPVPAFPFPAFRLSRPGLSRLGPSTFIV